MTAHFVERCPAPEPFLPAPVKVETTSKKRGNKSAKVRLFGWMSYKLTVGEKGKISYERINVSGKNEMNL